MHLLLPLLALASATAIPTLSGPPDIPDELFHNPSVHATYDYVVVGGGTAGITIASRLAENNYSVALVEAGGFYETKSLTASIPGADSLGVGSSIKSSSSIDWQFVAYGVPGANYRDVHYPRGKCLGGSYVLRAFAMGTD